MTIFLAVSSVSILSITIALTDTNNISTESVHNGLTNRKNGTNIRLIFVPQEGTHFSAFLVVLEKYFFPLAIRSGSVFFHLYISNWNKSHINRKHVQCSNQSKKRNKTQTYIDVVRGNSLPYCFFGWFWWLFFWQCLPYPFYP